MASPWKLLARLMLPRRQQKQEHRSIGDVKPDPVAIAKPTEQADNDGLTTAKSPADERFIRQDQLEPASADPDRSDKTANGVDSATDSQDARLVVATDPGFSDDADKAARDARILSQPGEGGVRKRGKRPKTEASSDGASYPSPDVSAVNGGAISLDEEIRFLREQLARKLRLQNAQLKKMLERFER